MNHLYKNYTEYLKLKELDNLKDKLKDLEYKIEQLEKFIELLLNNKKD